MATRLVLFAIFLFVFVASGCTAISPPVNRSATITATDAPISSSGARPAMVWTIDGKRVPLRYSEHRITPGSHTVSVLPLQDGPLSMTLSYGASSQARGVSIAELRVDVEEGQRLNLAAVLRRHRTYTGEGNELEPLEPWRTTVFPSIASSNQR